MILLLFSKYILLTPDFINIDSNAPYTLNLTNSINAISSGASIVVDVSKMIPNSNHHDFIDNINAFYNMFPIGSIEATLIAENITVKVTYLGNTAIGKKDVRLVLSGDAIPTGVDFNSISIKTSIKLNQVKVYWRNFTK
jgi:hypothetical protein